MAVARGSLCNGLEHRVSDGNEKSISSADDYRRLLQASVVGSSKKTLNSPAILLSRLMVTAVS